MKKALILVMLFFPSMVWAGDFKLDTAQSDINFVSIKKGSVGEVHHFSALTGKTDGNNASVHIDLSSVQTGVEVRNKRMQTMLFDVSKFASASIQADISALHVSTLQAGQDMVADLPLTLNLHGVEKTFVAKVLVVALANGGLWVSSRSPLMIKASDFGLEAGIEALRKVANLPNIATAVPVNFSLRFTQ